MTQPGFILP